MVIKMMKKKVIVLGMVLILLSTSIATVSVLGQDLESKKLVNNSDGEKEESETIDDYPIEIMKINLFFLFLGAKIQNKGVTPLEVTVRFEMISTLATGCKWLDKNLSVTIQPGKNKTASVYIDKVPLSPGVCTHFVRVTASESGTNKKYDFRSGLVFFVWGFGLIIWQSG